jgi:micrococcal nuclease
MRRGGARWTFAVVVALALAVAVALRGGCRVRQLPGRAGAPEPGPPHATAPSATRTCVRVIDGDTILLDGDERVRLIGVDTPELHRPNTPVQYFAREAGAFTRRLVEHRRVRLEYDRDRRDKYGRTLAYVRLEDGTFVNLEIVRRGYGFAYTRYPFRYLDEFRAAERAARKSGAGLWAEPDSVGRPA